MKTINYVLAIIILLSSTSMFAQKQDINTEKSTVEWLGKKIGGQHDGNILIKEGYFLLKDNRIAAGNFVMDMTSITNKDIEGKEYNDKLVGHLKSEDFFGVEKFPTAKFVITQSGKFLEGKATVKGDITIKGKTESIMFQVEKVGSDYIAVIEIDRSKFDVKYGSNSFFDNLGDKAIEDIFTLNIKLAVE